MNKVKEIMSEISNLKAKIYEIKEIGKTKFLQKFKNDRFGISCDFVPKHTTESGRTVPFCFL